MRNIYRFALLAVTVFAVSWGLFEEPKTVKLKATTNETSQTEVDTLIKSELTVTATTYTTISLSYSSDPDASYYQIFRANKKGGKYQRIATETTTDYLDKGLTNNKTYFYRVRSCKVDGISGKESYGPYSDVKSGKTTDLEKPDLTVSVISYNSLKLTFTVTDTNADGYQVFRATKKKGKYKLITSVTSDDFYLNQNLAFNKNFFYKIRAYKSIEGKTIYGPFSPIRSAKTRLGTPEIISTDLLNINQVKIVWSPVAGASGYTLQRYDDVTRKWITVKTVNTVTTEFTDSSLIIGRTYQYRLRALRKVGKKNIVGSYSLESAIYITEPVIGTPAINSIEIVNIVFVRLNWQMVEGINSYEIQRKDDVNTNWVTVKASGNSYTTVSLLLGRTYTFRMRAAFTNGNKDYYGPFTTEISTTIVMPTVGTPTLSLEVTGPRAIKASWTAVANATSYELERYNDLTSKWQSLAETTTLNRTDNNLIAHQTYKYRVRAIISIQGQKVFGDYSPEVSIKLSLGSDGRVPVDGYIDGSEVYKTKPDIISELGSPTKTYTTTDGEILIYNNNGAVPLKLVELKGGNVTAVLTSDPTEVDMYGIRVGDSSSSVVTKMKAKFGNDMVVVRDDHVISVKKPYYEEPIHSYYYQFNNKIVHIYHVAYLAKTESPETFKVSLVNEDVAAQIIIDLTNDYRRSLGFSILTENHTASAVAKAHSLDMFTNDYFSHTSKDGRTPGQRLSNAGVSNYSGENIAAGNINPLDIFYQWVHSTTGHRENIINASHVYIGVGVIYGRGVRPGTATYQSYITQVFTR